MIYDVVHYMLNMRSYGMNYAFSQLLWNIRALCDGYEILVHYVIWNICALRNEIYVRYVIKYEIYGCYENKCKNETSGSA